MASVETFRKAIGALKDSTQVGLANFNSENRVLDIAIVKATSHDEFIPKEKHVRRLFIALSAASPRPDVIYCIRGLAKRLEKTRTWMVALKVLLVIHRALREVGPTFTQELLSYCRGRGLNLSHFKDDSSKKAWDYSAWICSYAKYLEERLESFTILKYDVQMDTPKTRVFETSTLLEQLPVLQSLLNRLLTCKPLGAAANNALIHFPLSIVAGESVQLYVAIADGIRNLVDKYFEMQRHDAIRALELYRMSANQAERLSEFFQICRALAYGRDQKFVKVERPPASFIGTMEDYVRNGRQTLVHRSIELNYNQDTASKETGMSKETVAYEAKLPSDHKQYVNAREKSETSSYPPKSVQSVPVQIPDLLCMDEITVTETEPRDTNPLALQVVNSEYSSNSAKGIDMADPINWELALVTVPSSNVAVDEQRKLVGVLDKFTLDSLYDAAATARITNQNGNSNMGLMSSNSYYYNENSVYGSSHGAPPGLQQQQQQQAFFTQWQL